MEARGFGHDRVTDFAAGVDKLAVSVATYGILSRRLDIVGGDAVITMVSDSITLAGVTALGFGDLILV